MEALFTRKPPTGEEVVEAVAQDFFDRIVPSAVRFFTDHYIRGNLFCSAWALREYLTATEEQAILRSLGDKGGVTLRAYCRPVTFLEQRNCQNSAYPNLCSPRAFGKR